jgi:type 1 glutamine amidotransferase
MSTPPPAILPRRQFLQLLTAGAVAAPPLLAAVTAPSPTRVLIIVGPSSHPPGTHEVAASGRLMQHCLEHMTNVPGVSAQVFEEWPTDSAVRAAAATVVFIGDLFPLSRLPNPARTLRELGAMMDRGCGLVCIHYATGLRSADVAADGEHPLLHWLGGYFADKTPHHQSVARVYPQVTITPATPAHPVSRGVREYTLHDEPYYHNYFGPNGNQLAANVVPLATAMLPPEAPRREVVAWGVERTDGGRGFGIVMPHFYRNWSHEDLRRSILNGIVWTAQREVPVAGVATAPPELAAFAPVSVEPLPRPPAAVPAG